MALAPLPLRILIMWIQPPIDLSQLPRQPGVYRMLDKQRKVLYVGKARNLRKRVSGYFQKRPDSPRIEAMLCLVKDIDFTVTESEAAALVLEHNLIKQLKPRYNVLLKDAKSYPYILLTDETYPRLRLYRGNQNIPGQYFGPFPHASAVHETLHLMQRLFQLRDCENTEFRNRSRPCMQHQIGRCTAPCCGRVSRQDYLRQVEQAREFLLGHNQQCLERWQREMEQASRDLDFEHAAMLRDRIRTLRLILADPARQDLPDDADALVILRRPEAVHVGIGIRRGGRELGHYTLPVKQALDASDEEILQSLCLERYSRCDPPQLILVDTHEMGLAAMRSCLRLLHENKTCRVMCPKRGAKAEWLRRLRHASEQQAASRSNIDQQAAFKALATLLRLPNIPECIAAIDNAHLGGQQMVAAVVYATWSGPDKRHYRRYKLQDTGDDYAGMHEALSRHFRHIRAGDAPMPDLLLIDGGPGQLEAACQAAKSHGMEKMLMLAVAKGPSRKLGQESLWPSWMEGPLKPGRHSPALLLIARIRDEAHRFAGELMRKRKKKGMLRSQLDAIPGIGPTRRTSLLRYFGGLEGIKKASREQLMEVPGISRELAERIFDKMHS